MFSDFASKCKVWCSSYLLPVEGAVAVDCQLSERLLVVIEGDGHGQQQVVAILLAEVTQLPLQVCSLEELLNE